MPFAQLAFPSCFRVGCDSMRAPCRYLTILFFKNYVLTLFLPCHPALIGGLTPKHICAVALMLFELSCINWLTIKLDVCMVEYSTE